MRPYRSAMAAMAALAALACAADARAEPTSWLAFGGGYALARNQLSAYDDRATVMTMSLGVGSTAHAPVVVGGIFRTTTYFTLGTDVGFLARIATGGFARGDWGLALDFGPTARWWKDGDYGRYPLQGILTAGLPWGLQVGVGASFWGISGAPYARSGFAVLELDLLRFTLMRQGSTESFWPNPAPPDGPQKTTPTSIDTAKLTWP